MSRIINEIVEKCEDCVYNEHDAYVSRPNDSGYHCKLVKRRIIDDSKRQYLIDEILESFPEWCPLDKYIEPAGSERKLDAILFDMSPEAIKRQREVNKQLIRQRLEKQKRNK